MHRAQLDERDAAAGLFIELLRQKASSLLTLTQDTTVRLIHFEKGQVRFAQSSVKSELAGAAQVASGSIKQASFDRAIAFAKQNKVALHEALAYSRVLTPEQLKQALRQQTVDASVNGLSWTRGTWRVDPQSSEQLAASRHLCAEQNQPDASCELVSRATGQCVALDAAGLVVQQVLGKHQPFNWPPTTAQVQPGAQPGT